MMNFMNYSSQSRGIGENYSGLLVHDFSNSSQGLTLQNEEKTTSFNERIRSLCVSISQKDDFIVSLERKIADLQTENSENDVEIHSLYKEKKELQNDINILTEAFTKRGIETHQI